MAIDDVLDLLVYQVSKLHLGIKIETMALRKVSSKLSRCVPFKDNDALDLILSKVDVYKEKRPWFLSIALAIPCYLIVSIEKNLFILIHLLIFQILLALLLLCPVSFLLGSLRYLTS